MVFVVGDEVVEYVGFDVVVGDDVYFDLEVVVEGVMFDEYEVFCVVFGGFVYFVFVVCVIDDEVVVCFFLYYWFVEFECMFLFFDGGEMMWMKVYLFDFDKGVEFIYEDFNLLFLLDWDVDFLDEFV